MPNGVSNTQASNVDLTAEAVTGSGTPGTAFAGAGVDGGDAIVGNTGARATARASLVNATASVALVKSVTLRDPLGGTSAVPGTIASFTIEARVSGTGSIANLVVIDAIPDGTTYLPGTLVLDAAALTDGADGDAGTASESSGIDVKIGNVTAGSLHRVNFDVVINQ